MAGTGDDVHLLLTGQVDELDRVAGDTDGEVCVLFLLGMLHGVDQLLLAKDVDVQVVGTLIEVAVHDLHQILDALALAVTQCIGVDGLGVGDAVQSLYIIYYKIPVYLNIDNKKVAAFDDFVISFHLGFQLLFLEILI